MIIHSHYWYYRFIKPLDGKSTNYLLKDHPIDTLKEKLLIHMTAKSRLFTIFNSYLDFAKYELNFKPRDRCFYETIIGDFYQKPHFDIDVNLKEDSLDNSDKIIDNLIDSIKKVLERKSVVLDLNRDILHFTSHGKTKQSYHIIIDNFFHHNNLEAKAFYNHVISEMDDKYKKFIDASVYSSKQQFRIVGSQKLNSNRPKILSEQWLYKNELIKYQYTEEPTSDKHKMILQLEASLISHTTTCKFFPIFVGKTRKIFTDNRALTNNEIKYCLNLLASHGGMNYTSPNFPYKFQKVQKSLIVLKRIKPSKCQICQRIHDHENPYLVVNNDNNVYYHCRRAPMNSKWLIGNLKVNKVEKSNLNDRLTHLAEISNKKEKKKVSTYKERQNIFYNIANHSDW